MNSVSAANARPANPPAPPATATAVHRGWIFTRGSSIFKTHQASPRKITSSSIVDKPDTLNRQSNSEPRTSNAESHAAGWIEQFSVRKKMSA
jgi:hypothetical protein